MASSIYASRLETERLFLMLYVRGNPSHSSHGLALINAPGAIAVMGDMHIRTREEYDRLLMSTLVRPAILGLHRDTTVMQPGFWNVHLKRSDWKPSEMIGGTSIAQRGAKVPPDMGWVFLPAHWNKGYATEAGKEALRYLREELRLKEITAHPLPTNVGSIRTAQKIGLVEGGWVRVENGEKHVIFTLAGMRRIEGVVMKTWGKEDDEVDSTA